MSPLENPIPVDDRTSFWQRDGLLRRWLARRMPKEHLAWAAPRLDQVGAAAAGEMRELSAIADKDSPRLVNFDARGERIDRIDYHPAYRRMEEIGYGSGAIALKYDPEQRRERGGSLHAIGFSIGYLFGMTECGLFCPA